MDKQFFQNYYFNRKLSFANISKLTGYSVGSLHRHFHKLNLKPIKHEQWNKGKTCFEDPRILSGIKHPRWKDSTKYYIDFKIKRAKMLQNNTKCDFCDKPAFLLHHKDLNTTNNNDINLQPLCSSCHTTIHNKMRGITVYKGTCVWCKKQFNVYHNKKCNRKFCSRSCASKNSYYSGQTGIKNAP